MMSLLPFLHLLIIDNRQKTLNLISKVCQICCYTMVLFILDPLRSDCIHLYALLVFYPSRVTVTDSWVELCTNMILCQELGEGEGGEGGRKGDPEVRVLGCLCVCGGGGWWGRGRCRGVRGHQRTWLAHRWPAPGFQENPQVRDKFFSRN